MNAQTPGPLAVRQTGIGFPYLTVGIGARESIVCQTYVQQPEPQAVHANARLLASAYTAFDRAGRALHCDAAELAASLDLVTLIRAAQSVLAAIDGGITSAPDAPFREVWPAEDANTLRAALSTLPRESAP